jgi:hypothetical protein
MKRFLLVSALATFGCSDQSPDPPLVVTITPSATVTGASRIQDGETVYGCDYLVTASATGGKGGDAALWHSANTHWRLTSTGETHDNQLTRDEVNSFFGSDRVLTGQSATANRTALWFGPFTLLHEFFYTLPNGKQGRGEFLLTCT